MMPSWDFDVAVVGGGPAGAAAASVLAREDHRVLVLERERFPRFHIGESQLPWMNEALDRIGVRDVVAAAGFVEKWGASFTTADASASQYADFAQAVEVPTPRSYQVERSTFDRLLLEHANKCGAQVLQGHAASDVAFDANGAILTYAAGSEMKSARVGAVVDASGRTGFLAKRLGERRHDPLLNNIAVHRHYKGVPRDEGRRAGDIRMVTRPDNGWFWFIPISPTIVSVGVVVPQAAYRAAARATAAETLTHFLDDTPAAAQLVANATPITAARFDADYSYLHTQHAGDRFVIAGDAGAFLDPIFSTGVLMALQSGIEAAEVVGRGLRDGNLRASQFAGYERRLVRRYRHFRRFAVGFYDPAFRDLFFNPSSRFGLYEAVLSVLGGNWRPSWSTRLKIEIFFSLVALQKIFPLTRRLQPALPHPARQS